MFAKSITHDNIRNIIWLKMENGGLAIIILLFATFHYPTDMIYEHTLFLLHITSQRHQVLYIYKIANTCANILLLYIHGSSLISCQRILSLSHTISQSHSSKRLSPIELLQKSFHIHIIAHLERQFSGPGSKIDGSLLILLHVRRADPAWLRVLPSTTNTPKNLIVAYFHSSRRYTDTRDSYRTGSRFSHRSLRHCRLSAYLLSALFRRQVEIFDGDRDSEKLWR